MSLLIYDKRKDKMVSYTTKGFEHQEAVEIFKHHKEVKNKKLEVYNEENYLHFVVNPSIEDYNNPFLIFNTENHQQDSQIRSGNITGAIADQSKNQQLETFSFKDKNTLPPEHQLSLRTSSTGEYKCIFKSPQEPSISKVEEQFKEVDKMLK